MDENRENRGRGDGSDVDGMRGQVGMTREITRLSILVLSVLCGSWGIFCLWESFYAGQLAIYAILFLVCAVGLECSVVK